MVRPFSSTYSPQSSTKTSKKYTKEGRSIHIAKYYAMCEWFDETCGDLLKIIDENGDRENTLVVYVTDNGWIQNPDRGGYDARSKQTPYEGGIRTPIMFRWPPKMKPDERKELVSSIDIVPTILAASGVKAPENYPVSISYLILKSKFLSRETSFSAKVLLMILLTSINLKPPYYLDGPLKINGNFFLLTMVR